MGTLGLHGNAVNDLLTVKTEGLVNGGVDF
jgi:hypothetical protein